MAFVGAFQSVAFISYSHDSQDHMDHVLALADRLRDEGIDAVLDQYIESPVEGWPKWMQRQIDETDFTLVVCSDIYSRRFEGKEEAGRGLGAAWEGAIVTQSLFQSASENTRFIPVVFKTVDTHSIPTVLKGATYYDLSTQKGYEALYRRLTKQPLTPIPPLGPIKGMPPRERKQLFKPLETQNVASIPSAPTIQWTSSSASVEPLDSQWVNSARAQAFQGLTAIGKTGFKEVRFTLTGHVPNKKQPELLRACERAAVHTFGWPIGVVLLNRPEYRPRPLVNGIVAEVSTDDKNHYQYWALRTDGDFYLLKSLFEDVRRPTSIFFNTRMARATEVFQYCSRLYKELGVPEDTIVHVGVRYGGLQGRTLRSVGNRHLWEGRKTQEDMVEAVASSALGDIDARIVELVKEICSPLFVLFDFFEPSHEVYEEIVAGYITGKMS